MITVTTGNSVDAIHVPFNVVPRGTRPEREVVILSDTSYMAQTEVRTTAETTGQEGAQTKALYLT
jgi:hypothetical protein